MGERNKRGEEGQRKEGRSCHSVGALLSYLDKNIILNSTFFSQIMRNCSFPVDNLRIMTWNHSKNLRL